MSNTYDAVSAYVDRMSEEEIKSYDFYPMKNQPLENFRSYFLSHLEDQSLLEAFYSDNDLKYLNA